MPSTTGIHDPDLFDSDSHDSDFAASLSASDTEGSTSSDGESRRRPKRKVAGDEDALASGDEGIVESGKRKKRRKHTKKSKSKESKSFGQHEEGYESEEGVGARLRRRRDGKAERGPRKKEDSKSKAVDIDVDALWAQMNNAPSTRPTAPPPPLEPHSLQSGEAHTAQNEVAVNEKSAGDGITAAAPNAYIPDDMISIKRTYNFAGSTTVEEKLVPKDSAEAQHYLASQPSIPKSHSGPNSLTTTNLCRPLKRPSRFDSPIPSADDLLKTTAAIKAPVTAQIKSLAELKLERGQKLNTIEKSKLDWAGYVDKEKLKDELDKAEKAKGGYLDRMEFLGRSEAARDEVLKEGRKR